MLYMARKISLTHIIYNTKNNTQDLNFFYCRLGHAVYTFRWNRPYVSRRQRVKNIFCAKQVVCDPGIGNAIRVLINTFHGHCEVRLSMTYDFLIILVNDVPCHD